MKTIDLAGYIAKILSAVERDGDNALLRFGARFDGVNLSRSGLRVREAEIRRSSAGIPVLLRDALDKAASNVKSFHDRELKNMSFSWSMSRLGATTGQVIRSVESVGIYVPGGRFSYPSTVLMTAIPARAAGVKKIVIVSPPGNITPGVLYAARISGVSEIYRVGGPWAIAALAFGTASIPKVDLIVGPGNKYVNEAKRQVFGRTGIDSLAGPSEIAIIADDSADERFIARDILAQLEHAPDAKAYLFTDSRRILRGVNSVLGVKAGGKQFKAVKCSLGRAVELVNGIAPEHLEIAVKNARRIAANIHNAGAVFIGNYSPVAAGDYWAGPSHTLPTAGASRFSSGISVCTFLKRTSFIEFSEKSLAAGAGWIKSIARAEGLIEHGRSIEIRERQK